MKKRSDQLYDRDKYYLSTIRPGTVRPTPGMWRTADLVQKAQITDNEQDHYVDEIETPVWKSKHQNRGVWRGTTE